MPIPFPFQQELEAIFRHVKYPDCVEVKSDQMGNIESIKVGNDPNVNPPNAKFRVIQTVFNDPNL